MSDQKENKRYVSGISGRSVGDLYRRMNRRALGRGRSSNNEAGHRKLRAKVQPIPMGRDRFPNSKWK